jgi:glycosyltransferase involved in cell wall biosynthesis
MESRAFAAADGIVTLTERIWPAIQDWKGLGSHTVHHEVIPCCTDLEKFRFSAEDRAEVRNELNLEDQFVMVYSGSVGGWYLTEQMADLFVELRKLKPDSHFLWLTGGSRELVEQIMTARGMKTNQFSVRNVKPADVPRYLCAADAGVAFYKPTFSRLATSPVKLAEYLACGLSLIINSGVGDSGSLIREQNLGAVVEDFNSRDYRKALLEIDDLMGEQARTRARGAAAEFFDVRTVGVDRYARLYLKVLDNSN